jgi:uncharacterized membrane protein
MSDLIAITFDGADDAAAALHSVRSLEHEGRFKLEDTAVVTKDAEGKVHVKNEMSSGTETGAVVGAVLGGLLFVVFPVAIVGGAIVGGKPPCATRSSSIDWCLVPPVKYLTAGRHRPEQDRAHLAGAIVRGRCGRT